MSNQTVGWLGQSFYVRNRFIDWYDIQGVYIFTGLNAQNQWEPYYVGETQSFKDRFADHEVWDKAVRLGATHVHERVTATEADRMALESALIRAYQPPLNTQLKARAY